MSDHNRASRGRYPWLRGLKTPVEMLRHYLKHLMRGRGSVPVDELDDRLKRDIGVDPTLPQDHRTAHYLKMMQRGQPLT